MKITRRIIALASIVAVTALLSVWVTTGAASPQSHSSVLPTMHFLSVPTAYHMSNSSANAGVGPTFEEIDKFVSGGKQIGTGFLTGTFMEQATVMIDIEARFPGRGRVELQGVVPNSPTAPQSTIITGGTGIFSGAIGKAVSVKNHVTVTFR